MQNLLLFHKIVKSKKSKKSSKKSFNFNLMHESLTLLHMCINFLKKMEERLEDKLLLERKFLNVQTKKILSNLYIIS